MVLFFAHTGTGANGEQQLIVNLELNGIKYTGVLVANAAAAARGGNNDDDEEEEETQHEEATAADKCEAEQSSPRSDVVKLEKRQEMNQQEAHDEQVETPPSPPLTDNNGAGENETATSVGALGMGGVVGGVAVNMLKDAVVSS